MSDKQPGEKTRTEAAAFFGVETDTFSKYVKEYDIPHRLFKRRMYFLERDLELAKQRIYGGEKRRQT